MAEGLATADGKTIDLGNLDVDQEFARAMAAPDPGEPQAPAPPDVAPFDPEAPFGRRVDGTPKKAPGGRPPKERPRTTTKAAVPDPQAGKGDQKPDYTAGLQEFFGGISMALAVLPVPSETMRVRMRVQAAVLKDTGDGLAAGTAITAQHSGIVRWGVEKLTQGGGSWVFPAALAIMPFAVQTSMLWKAPVDTGLRETADAIETSAMAEFKAQMGIIPGLAEESEQEAA